MARKHTKKNEPPLADAADKYRLYQMSVQAPENEVLFFKKAYEDAYRRAPATLREDFCGTFAVSCEWVKDHPSHRAVGVDLDPEPLAWGRANNLSELSSAQQERIRVLQQDVRKRDDPEADVLAAQNFSFWIFKTRDEILEYFSAARANLKEQGVMVLDMMGGSDCLIEDQTDKRTIVKGKKGFQYHWHQARFDPITHDASFYISFKFADGSRLKNAFQYHWRFWSIPEVRELLAAAGFRETHVYWDMADDDDDEEEDFARAAAAATAPCWLSYIVAVK